MVRFDTCNVFRRTVRKRVAEWRLQLGISRKRLGILLRSPAFVSDHAGMLAGRDL